MDLVFQMAFHTLLHSRPLAYPYVYHAHKSAKAYYNMGESNNIYLHVQDVIYQPNIYVYMSTTWKE